MYRAQALSAAQQERLTAVALQRGKAVVVGPVFDTIKRVDNGLVTETLDRDRLRQPLAWACTSANVPPSDPPPADWFVGAAVIE